MSPAPKEPTPKQLQYSAYMGWEYMGDCLFQKGDLIGWYHERGFWKE